MTKYVRGWLFFGMVGMLLAGCGRGPADEVVLVSRQNSSGTYEYFREAVLGKERDYKRGMTSRSGSKEVVDLVATTPTAIGYSGMGYATEDVKMLKIAKEQGGEAFAPTMENVKSGDYPLARPLYLYTAGEPTGAIKHFVDWIRSEEGQQVVKDSDYVPVAPQTMTDEQPPAGTIKITGSDTMLELAKNWAGAYMKKYRSVSVQVNGGGSGMGIASLVDGTTDIANASREINEEEKKRVRDKNGKETVEFTVALDALAVYIHKDNPLEVLSLPELAEIYGREGNVSRWSQVEGWRTSDSGKAS